jgi:hypothetical protein
VAQSDATSLNKNSSSMSHPQAKPSMKRVTVSHDNVKEQKFRQSGARRQLILTTRRDVQCRSSQKISRFLSLENPNKVSMAEEMEAREGLLLYPAVGTSER